MGAAGCGRPRPGCPRSRQGGAFSARSRGPGAFRPGGEGRDERDSEQWKLPSHRPLSLKGKGKRMPGKTGGGGLTGSGRDATLAAARTPENAEDCGRVAAGRVERRRRPETAPAEPRGFPGLEGRSCPMSGRAMERLARAAGLGTQGSVGKRKAAGLALALAGFLAALFPDACRAARPDIVWMAGGTSARSSGRVFPGRSDAGLGGIRQEGPDLECRGWETVRDV